MRIAIIFMVLALPTVAVAKQKTEPFDISAIKDKLRILHDTKGHYVAYVPPTKSLSDMTKHFFYGDGKTFYHQWVPGGGRNGADYSCTISDPRVMYRYMSGFEVKGGKAVFTCEKRKTELVELDPKKTAEMLNQATFYNIFWQRVPHALARDTRGRYYYVDRLARSGDDPAEPLRGFRVFMGMRGKMKQLRMKNVVSDVAGEVFITPKGRLRLILESKNDESKNRAVWITGKRQRQLTRVPVSHLRTRVMIYRELGVYLGQALHRPCDDL